MIKKSGDLEFYSYPCQNISAHEKANSRTLIVLGETGCGKSTFLNSLANFLSGVDIWDPFRYLIVM